MAEWPVYAKIDGPIVLVGFGSIGKGVLPLIERHFTYDKSKFVVIDPSDKDRHLLDQRGIRFVKEALTAAQLSPGHGASPPRGPRAAASASTSRSTWNCSP